MESNEKHRLTRILVECPELIASVRVGVLNTLAPMEQQGLCQVQFRETRKITRIDLTWCDVLICVRGCEELSLRIAEEAKRLGRFLIYFLDDDLLHLPKETMAYEYFEYGDHQKSLRSILSISDGLWGVNSLIREIYLPMCGEERWILTRVPVKVQLAKEKQNDIVRILYAGSVDHQNLIREIVAPAVETVLKQLGEMVEFTFIGPNPGLHHYSNVIHRTFFDDYDQYHQYVEDNQFAIGLAPTRTGQFYQCKYYNKFVEYTSIGAVGIYTDSALYQQVVRHEVNGLLCENTPEAWADAIIRLVHSPALREKCFNQAQTFLKKQFAPEKVAEELVVQIPELSSFIAPKISKIQVHLCSPLLYFYWDRICYLFHIYHILAIPVILWKAVKRFIRLSLRKVLC